MKTSLPCLTLFLGLLCCGCVREGPYVPDQRQPSPEIENTAVILDRALAKLIAVDSQKAERTNSGKLITFANIRNRTNDDLQIQVQTIFRDANGFSTGDETAWETVVLTANSTFTASAIASDKKAERYTVRIRIAR